MGPPTVSTLSLPQQPYPKMNVDVVNRNLAQISFFTSGSTLKSGRKNGEMKVPKERGWYRRFRSSPQLDIAAVERTYEIALLLKSQPEKQRVFEGMRVNFEASLKGLERLLVHFNTKDAVKADRLRTLQNKIMTTLAEQELGIHQENADSTRQLSDDSASEKTAHIPTPPPQPAMERILPRKPTIRRRPQSVCFQHVDLERDFLAELFGKIKEKAPITEEVKIIKIETASEIEWEQAPDMTASVVRATLQRTVSYYDKRTPLYESMKQQEITAKSKEKVIQDEKKLQELQKSINHVVSARRLSMRGKGFSD